MELNKELLSIYLPYNLNIWHVYNERKYPLVVSNNTTSMKGGFNIDSVLDDDELIPIFRRLDTESINMEITHNNETFIPLEKLGEYFSPKELSNTVNMIGTRETMSVQFDIILKLAEWHFWVFNPDFFNDGTIIDMDIFHNITMKNLNNIQKELISYIPNNGKTITAEELFSLVGGKYSVRRIKYNLNKIIGFVFDGVFSIQEAFNTNNNYANSLGYYKFKNN